MIGGQFHGKSFEDWVKGCRFPGAADGGRSNTATFDVEARFDRELGLPTSIKSGRGNGIELSDARRFWEIDQEFRLLFGRYKQVDGVKNFDVVHEFLIAPEMLEILRGDLTPEEVKALHDGVGLANFPFGEHGPARIWARQQKRLLANRQTKIVLHPKIDSKSQRRVQCSVKLNDLVELCKPAGRYLIHDHKVGTCLLPFRIESPRRSG